MEWIKILIFIIGVFFLIMIARPGIRIVYFKLFRFMVKMQYQIKIKEQEERLRNEKRL